MAGLTRRSIDTPDESRPFKDGKGRLDLVQLEGQPVGRAVFESGWRWSDHVKPIAQTDSCQVAHLGYVVSGQMTIRMNDGQEETFGPGDFMSCAPGHDAWVVGDDACVVVDWQGSSTYAK